MKVDYFALAVAIAFGVFAGQGMYGLSKLAWAKYELRQLVTVLERENAAFERQTRENRIQRDLRAAESRRDNEIKLEKRRQETQATLEQQRRNSTVGRKLGADCLQWQQQLVTMKTETVELMAKHTCEKYEAYVTTGQS